MINSLMQLVFPNLCAACNKNLFRGEDTICNACLNDMPKTDFHQFIVNPVSKIFDGRIKLKTATSLFYFNKGGKIQNLLHKLKYKNRPDIGSFLGEVYAHNLLESAFYDNIDVIVPIPIHWKKRKIRGYNQAASFGFGLNKVYKVDFSDDYLAKNEFTESQIRKSRYERFENSFKKYDVIAPEKIKDRNILLVDDVITSGSTIESCAQELINHQAKSIVVVSIAFAGQ